MQVPDTPTPPKPVALQILHSTRWFAFLVVQYSTAAEPVSHAVQCRTGMRLGGEGGMGVWRYAFFTSLRVVEQPGAV